MEVTTNGGYANARSINSYDKKSFSQKTEGKGYFK